MHHAFAVRRIERFRDLPRQPHGFLNRLRSLERIAFYVFQHQVIRSDVEDLADVRMIQGGDRASFLLKARAVLGVQPLHRHDAIQPRVPRLPHLTHAARANRREDFIRAEFVAWLKRHPVDAVKFSRSRSRQVQDDDASIEPRRVAPFWGPTVAWSQSASRKSRTTAL